MFSNSFAIEIILYMYFLNPFNNLFKKLFTCPALRAVTVLVKNNFFASYNN